MLTKGLLFDDRYELIRPLGHGGFSEVWLALDREARVQVAVKVYASTTGLSEDGLETFRQEFALVFDLNHTNLLRPTYFGIWQQRPFLILPLCNNGSAMKYLKGGGRIPEKQAWLLLRDVAAGLAYMHSKNPPLIHQDIKPDNILISDEGRYMITDFGISSKVRSTIRTVMREGVDTTSSGTVCYMGPERFTSKPRPIMASDIWSLGAMMFELMTGGTPPFGNMGGVLQKNGADVPEIEDDYSQELKDIVYRCLSKEPWDRPPAIQIETMANDHIIGRTPTVKAAPPPANEPKKSQWPAIVAAVIGTLIIAAAGTWAYQHFIGNDKTTNTEVAQTTAAPATEPEAEPEESSTTDNNDEGDESEQMTIDEQQNNNEESTTQTDEQATVKDNHDTPKQPVREQSDENVSEAAPVQGTGFHLETSTAVSDSKVTATSEICVAFQSSTDLVAYIFVDNNRMGASPWKGTLTKGTHVVTVKIQKPGKKLKDINKSWTIQAPAKMTIPIDPAPFE